jgi:hypothetical protein
MQIDEIKTTEPYKLLGIQMAPADNQKGNIKMLKEKIEKMITLTKTANLPPAEMETCLHSIILPTLKYGQSAMSIPKITILEIQKPLINIILPKIGYNRHTPRALVYASKKYGGLAIPNLYTEQGIAQVKYIIGAMRNKCETTDLIRALMETYNITTGTLEQPFQNHNIVRYIDSNWINSIISFLLTINGKIIIYDYKGIQKLRTNDEAIMEAATKSFCTTDQLKAINNCRIYLQVVTFAEITNVEGTHILTEAMQGSYDNHGIPDIFKYSKSLANWPVVTRPPEKAWRIWKKWLRTKVFPKTNILKKPLLGWNTVTKYTRIWCNKNEQKTILDLTPVITQKSTRFNLNERIEMELIITAPTLQLTINSKTIKDECKTVWMLHKSTDIIKIEKKSRKTHIYHGRERGNLLAIYSALTYIVTSFQQTSSIPPPSYLSIRAPTNTVEKILKRAKFEDKTIYSLTRNEGDLINEINKLLNFFNRYKIMKPIINNNKMDSEMKKIKEMTHINKEEIYLQARNDYKPNIELIINSKRITGEMNNAIHHESTKNDYIIYLTRKMKWENNQPEYIDWGALEKATNNLTKSQHIFVSKYIHGWLPTRGHPGYDGFRCLSKTCPLCKEMIESNCHFLFCKWKREEDTAILTEKINETKTNTNIQKILIEVITSTVNMKEIKLNGIYKNLELRQKRIGYNQLLLGRYATNWADEYNKETNTQLGQVWIAKTIKTVWKHQQQRWYERNNNAEEEIKNKNTKCETTDNTIKEMYSQMSQLENIDQQAMAMPVKMRLDTTSSSKLQWIKRTKLLIKEGIKRQKIKTIKEHISIRKYFITAKSGGKPKNTKTASAENKAKRKVNKKRNKVCKENYYPP